jgi:hypothetical protein
LYYDALRWEKIWHVPSTLQVFREIDKLGSQGEKELKLDEPAAELLLFFKAMYGGDGDVPASDAEITDDNVLALLSVSHKYGGAHTTQDTPFSYLLSPPPKLHKHTIDHGTMTITTIRCGVHGARLHQAPPQRPG